MFLSFLKFLFFGSVMLLVGQIPIGGNTLGTKFYEQVAQACRWGTHQVHENKMFAGIGDLSLLNRWWGSPHPPKQSSRRGIGKKEEPDGRDSDADGLTPSDREALIRLLQ